MSRAAHNPNLRRRPLPGLLALSAAFPLRAILAPFRWKADPAAPLWVFSSYMIGDLFMALPALKRLSAAGAPLRVLCRPDCAELLRREGFDPMPFDNAFFVRKTPPAFLRTLHSAWRLRSLPGRAVLDLDADPRTAFWMRVAGAPRIVSFRRSFGVLFDDVFDLPADAIHQADKDRAVVEKWLKGRGTGILTPPPAFQATPSPLHQSLARWRGEGAGGGARTWLLSVWTRKAEKNWPLDRWEDFMRRMETGGIPFALLEAPDGDAGFRAFRERWRDRVEFVSGPLEWVAERVKGSAGIIATDNFLGHMAGYYGKPVLWINVCSPAAQVEPRGPRTLRAGAGRPGKPELPEPAAVWKRFAELREMKEDAESGSNGEAS